MVRAPSRRRLVVVAGLVLGFVLWPDIRVEAQAVPMCIGCTPDYKVQVTPDASPISRVAGTLGLQETFTVKNVGLLSDAYTMTCSTTGNVTCTNIAPSSFSLSANQTQLVTVTYNTGVAGSGTLTARAQGASDFWDTGSYTVTVTSAPPPPTVTLVLPTLTSGSRAVVAGRRPVIRALFTSPIAIDTTQTVLKWKGQVVTGLARHGRGVLEWEVDSTRGLAVGDSGLIEVKACASSCTTVTRYAVLPGDNKPLLAFTGMPLGAQGAGFSSPFGPGLAVSQAEVETGMATPGWSAMGVSRGVGLVYSTRQSYPRALVLVDLELTWPAGTPDVITLRLWDGGVKLDTLRLTTPTCATGAARRCRAVLQGDFSGSTFATPTRKYLKVEAVVTSGATSQTNLDSAEVVLVDRRTTAYGSGWWPAGVSQLVSAGQDRLLIGATGTATIYRGNGDTSFVAPPGVFVGLTKSVTGFALTPRGSTASVVFNASGQQVATIDPNLNVDSVNYDGSGRVARFLERTFKRDTLTYDGNGKLATITDPSGRVTAVTINGATHQLTYDSVWVTTQAPAHTYTYQAYAGTGTVVLTRRIGVLKDTTRVTYDSTFRRRPVQVALPSVQHPTSGTLVAPLVQYTAYERRGVGALVSLDSVYVMMTDPRGFWSKSLLNRWGQSLRSWDQLGLLSRSSYDADGFVLWSEGKVADSSRTYSVYDAARRLVKSYIVRAVGDTLRGDSLVYDASHRVIQVVDNRGKSSYVTYDGHGNVTKQKNPNNDSTVTWVRFNGLVDSVRAPGETASQRYEYDLYTRQVSRTIDATGDTTSTMWYDLVLGRLDSARTRIKGDTLSGYAWSKVRYHYMPVGLVDTVLTYRDSAGTAPPASWPVMSDTLKVRRRIVLHDRAGRDTAWINTRGTVSKVRLDKLGRVTHAWPQAGSPTVFDSLIHDLAGNVVKVVTRRGYTITADYDARNRDTLRVIPTVGTERKTYGGPLDQLTLWEITGYVDSIGGLNPKRAWNYDQRGRLKIETAYPLGTARAISYAYDAKERPYQVTDPLGTWTTTYDATRGLPAALTTPLGDSLTYGWDARGRAAQLTITQGGTDRVGITNSWNASGALSLHQTYAPPSEDPLTRKLVGRWQRYGAPAGSPAVLTRWQEWTGTGTAMDTLLFNSVYDGWERLTTSNATTYAFDATGNVKGSTVTSQVIDGPTDRLTSHTMGGITWTYAYDAAGNMITAAKSGESWVYGYDALNRLVSARRNNTLISRYAYDVTGRRIAKKVYNASSGGTVGFTGFLYQGGNVAFETDAAGTIGRQYLWGPGSDNLLGFKEGANRYYVATDQLGSVRLVVSSASVKVMGLRYGVYGTLSDSSGTGIALRYRWTGREWDAELGMYYMRARYYHPRIARFVQEDPAADGPNLYSYVGGSPLEYTDPSGLMKQNDGKFGGVCFAHSCMNWDGTMVPGGYTGAGGGGGGSGGGNIGSSSEWGFGLLNPLTQFESACKMNCMPMPSGVGGPEPITSLFSFGVCCKKGRILSKVSGGLAVGPNYTLGVGALTFTARIGAGAGYDLTQRLQDNGDKTIGSEFYAYLGVIGYLQIGSLRLLSFNEGFKTGSNFVDADIILGAGATSTPLGGVTWSWTVYPGGVLEDLTQPQH